MKWPFTNPRTRLYLIAAVILLTGLSSAALIYFRAVNTPDNALLNEFEYSKRYQHDLELYGGKANVIASEITNWFSGLWHGKSLACVIACFTILVSLGFFYAAGRLPSGPKSDPRSNAGKHG